MYDVVIIGGGVIGAMAARTLAAYQLSLCVLERANDVAEGATKANSAIVHAGFDAETGSQKAKFNVLGAKMMPKVTEELDVRYRQNGSMVIGFDDEDRKHLEALLQRGVENGVEGLRLVEGEELFALEPALSKDVTCALYAPTGGIVCPYELTIAAVGNAMDNGAELKRNFEVCAIERTDDHFVITAKDGSAVSTRYIVNAAGLYTDEIAAMVGDTSFSIHPRRGEYILLDKTSGSLVSHTIFRTPGPMGKGILVSPTVDGNLLTGPTSEDGEDKEDKDTTLNGFARIMQQGRENIEKLNFRESITSFCGLRAVGSTGDFIINNPCHGFVNAAGIESPGLSSAPAVALEIKRLLEEDGLQMEKKTDFQPCRKSPHFFRNATMEEKNAIIKEDKRFGHIICRCESVTEGEILYALKQNPKPLDLDGIKRRTRAQMGRCQGGFCSPYLVELLANELDVDCKAVTKAGGESRIIVGRTKGEEKHD